MTRFIIPFWYYFLISVSLPQILFANDSTDDLLGLSLEELTQVKVLIATGIEQDIKDAPAAVTLITADDIKKTGATNLIDVLEGIPGIHIKTDSFGNRPLIHMRGGTSHQTLLMVNGNPMKDLAWAFGLFWKGLPVSIIERVEVIRGPGSALYGADASTGVINVITKTSGKIEGTEMGIRAGSFDTRNGWLQTGGNINGFELGFTADISTTDGHDPQISSDRQGLSGHPDYGWDNSDIRFSIAKENWKLLANYSHHDSVETGMTGSGYFDPVTKADDERYDIDLIYNNKDFSKNWGLDAKLHYQDLDYSSGDGFRETPPFSTDFNGLDKQLTSNEQVSYPDGLINQMSSSERQVSLEASGLYSGINNHSIRIGAGYQWQDIYEVEQKVNFLDRDGNPLASAGPLLDISGTSAAFVPEDDRSIQFLFIQDVWNFADDWELTAGLRYDNYSDFGDTFNPRLAMIWQSTESLTTKLMYGHAFRAPSFQELYADTARATSNDDLDAEKSETWELALSYEATKDINLGLNIYNIEQTDTIAKDSNRQYQNLGDHETFGVEIEASWQATRHLTFSGNYSYIDPQDNELRNFLDPQQEAYLRSDWNFKPDWNWDIQANWIADRERQDGDSRSDVDDYIVADTTLRYSGIQKWEFAVSVRNIFDEDAREALGTSVENDFPLPERNAYAELRYKF